MLGLAHHLVFNCENHYAKIPLDVTVKFNYPQKHVRHTVPFRKLITLNHLHTVLDTIEVAQPTVGQARNLARRL
jgi:hypothetical protein